MHYRPTVALEDVTVYEWRNVPYDYGSFSIFASNLEPSIFPYYFEFVQTIGDPVSAMFQVLPVDVRPATQVRIRFDLCPIDVRRPSTSGRWQTRLGDLTVSIAEATARRWRPCASVGHGGDRVLSSAAQATPQPKRSCW